MSEPVNKRMKISREGVLLIKSFEGFRPRGVRRDGRWIVGYGHTASAREGVRISEAEAELLLQYDLIPVQAALAEGLTRPVNQHQYDALASFAFSVGVEAFRASNVLAQVNAGASSDAADSLVGWPEPPVRDAGLRRRAAERALFNADPASAVTLSDLLVAPVSADPAEPATGPANDEVPIFAPPAPTPIPNPTVVGADQSLMVAPGGAPADSALSVITPADPATTGGFSPPSVDALTPAPVEVAQGVAPTTAVPMTPTIIAADPLTGAVAPALPAEPATVDEAAAQGALQTTGVLTEGVALSSPRLVWPQGQAEGADASYQDQGRLEGSNAPAEAGEPSEAPVSGLIWRRVWGYLVMGGFGLVSVAMAMAALRMASTAASDVASILAIAGVLAVIGAVCVGVSGYNLYQRLSDDR